MTSIQQTHKLQLTLIPWKERKTKAEFLQCRLEGKHYTFKSVQEARDFAHSKGYLGIKIT